MDKSSSVDSRAAKVMAIPFIQPLARIPPPLYHSSSPTYSGPYQQPGSPQNRNVYSSSPRMVSPAGSQIFERDVQENSSLTGPNSPAIPLHMQTENHIPPVLDASSEAITNNTIDPDSVEIIMASSHQPAALTVAGIGSDTISGSWPDDVAVSAHPDKDETASNYSSFDGTDVRRLSFISFADVVLSEHAEHQQHSSGRDSIFVAGLSSLSSQNINRSPSPIRSPVSASSLGFGTSPPTSKSASVKGLDLSPARKTLANPIILSPGGNDLTVETMTQALKRTRSGDLSGI